MHSRILYAIIHSYGCWCCLVHAASLDIYHVCLCWIVIKNTYMCCQWLDIKCRQPVSPPSRFLSTLPSVCINLCASGYRKNTHRHSNYFTPNIAIIAALHMQIGTEKSTLKMPLALLWNKATLYIYIHANCESFHIISRKDVSGFINKHSEILISS